MIFYDFEVFRYYVTNNPDFTELQRAEMFSIWAFQSVAE